MLNPNTVQSKVNELWHEGYISVPFDRSLVSEQRELYKLFLQRRIKYDDGTKWVFKHPNEHEPDFGLLSPRMGKDLKYSFHHNQYFTHRHHHYKRRVTKEDVLFLRVTYELYAEAAKLAQMFCAVLDRHFDLDVSDSYRESLVDFPAYSITTLRSLWYPDEVGQNGAKAHIDRDLITLHFGDEHGKLQQLQDAEDNNGVDISPRLGEVGVFFGVKVLWATDGRKTPTWHRALTETGKDRSATVFFGHIDVPNYKVVDANEAYDYFIEQM